MSTFNFKHFKIQQHNAALKVGTDAMLLGSLCNWGNPKRLLDIGTGTGVLALMCAQRFNFDEIIGLEIASDALVDAKRNTEDSPFTSPINVIDCRLQDYNSEVLFDAIISNPPFFENSLKNQDEQLGIARHTDTLSYTDLICNIARLLHPDGIAWLILPDQAEESILALAAQSNLFASQLIRLEGKPDKHVRTIFALQKSIFETQISSFTIRAENGDYSTQYKALTKEFHDRVL